MHFIMSSTSITFRMPIRDPPLLTTLVFCQWYRESNTTEVEYDLSHTGLVCIHRHYTETTSKSKFSMIAGFKEYMAIASSLELIDEEVSSSEDEEKDGELEGEAISVVAIPFVREGESDASKEDSDDTLLVHFVVQ